MGYALFCSDVAQLNWSYVSKYCQSIITREAETSHSRPITIFPQPPLCTAVSNYSVCNDNLGALFLRDNKAGLSLQGYHAKLKKVEASSNALNNSNQIAFLGELICGGYELN